ncbi:TPA: ATP-grasp domain-containing protein [Candidatus Thalassarchaeaceae archaeon]|jgi:acetyl-CoA carboxylase biotin carboxylase subunit|nr:ATP-grasp domain-containing protein [Euryarchaeota archaeon]DAC62037.1 MAG TPA: ATP-grasp domain-containing protein [Candidatus Poseidoniales archaeon]HIH05685.1 ATP-grasp domain-containing protein [Candidatus Thalassarchaeaceae archaeon]MBT3847127.1 ATP-grasp domain-containing protein [Euryarchaeota archaeon]MBT4156306.1 ATP-grasp domain-containing protein [Euryarchaeota archaeon]
MFRRVLIANRGEIALRILRSLHSLGIEAVMIYGREDRISTPVRLADESVYIPRDDPLASYLDIEAIVAAAKEVGADAVHPGYGFLAENPTFARRLSEEGIIFIGPSPEVLQLLGDKITAREAMSKAGLPIARGSPGPISNPEEASIIAEEIGFPVIIKAAAGGGGIGMQVVESSEEFESAMQLCQGRALSAFGDDRVFLEKFIEGAQHIEFQVLGDGKDAIHFGERFCSIQRRHQKILEEGPWLSEEIRQEIGNKVVEGAKAVGYCGLATFEFLRDSNGDFYFLEVNPRVQVEHTVTEMITGTDLVSLGIRVASGEEIRLKQNDININGHAIQVRLNAENPVTLAPSPGKLWECHWPGGPGVRIDTHAYTGYDMPSSFDSLLAKLIVWAPSRDESIAKLKAALSETKLLGVDTLIPLHQAILSEDDFRKRNITIHYLEEHKNLL